MEIVRKRILILGIAMCLVGALGAVESQLQQPKVKVTEEFMVSKTPPEVDGFLPVQLPRAGQDVYDMLQPFGIVAMDYHKDSKVYDVMLIASDRRESFHSPNVCMPAQGLNITKEHDETITTRTHGKVRVTVAELEFPNAPHEKQYMAFFYKVQNKFVARSGNTTLVLTLAMFEGPIRGNFDQNTVFYRFISEHANANKEELLQFVADYLDKAHETSGGFF